MKKFLILTLLTFLLFPLLAQSPDSNKIVITDLGDKIQISIGDSISSFSHEYMAQYYLDKGIENGSVGDFEGAISNFNLALLYIDDNPDIFYNRGLANYYLNDFVSSIEDLTSAIKLDPSHYNALNQRGIAYSKTNEYVLAMEDFNQAIKQYPDLSKAYLNKGINYLLMDDWEDACKLLKIALEKGDDKAAGVIQQYCY